MARKRKEEFVFCREAEVGVALRLYRVKARNWAHAVHRLADHLSLENLPCQNPASCADDSHAEEIAQTLQDMGIETADNNEGPVKIVDV